MQLRNCVAPTYGRLPKQVIGFAASLVEALPAVNGLSSESRQARLDGRVVADEGVANVKSSQPRFSCT